MTLTIIEALCYVPKCLGKNVVFFFRYENYVPFSVLCLSL